MPSVTRRLLPPFAAFMVILFAPANPWAAPMEKHEKGKANRLAKESSPYLLQHALNPVDWFPWGPEAFEKAKKEGKLIFLSIGYSSCHWCHVMEKESFSQQDVADVLNKHFVCIKVDREERPDVDDIYMTALHTMGARGGWPLSMFLTPDGKPIVGGTYWPKEDKQVEGGTMNGFKSILKRILDVWTEKPKEMQSQADHFAEQTIAALNLAVRGNPLVKLERSLARGAAEQLQEEIDPVHGGIGRKSSKFQGTKFPMVSSVAVLLDHARREKDPDLTKLVRLTLDRMAMGGIYDQLGGGFHRYSTERTWTVPHFEKMLYDNAQLVELYADAYAVWKDPYYDRVIRHTLAFIEREMTSPEGGYYSALDADSNGKEGEFYIWAPGEIEKALGNRTNTAFVESFYGVGEKPNFEGKANILRLHKPLAEIAGEHKLSVRELEEKLGPLTAELMQYRSKRERPFLDTKILTSWNGQMIGAYARAGQVLKEDSHIKAAARAADFVLTKLRNKDGRLLRTYSTTGEGKAEAKLNAYLDDYAFLIHGLLNLHDATGEKHWLDEAKALNAQMVKWYGDPEAGGYYFTSSDHEKLFARPKDYADNAQPSANGIALRNQVRLWQLTREADYKNLAEKGLRQYAGIIRSNPTAVPNMCLALHEYLDRADATGKPAEKKEDAVAGPQDETTEKVVKLVAERIVTGDKKSAVRVTLTMKEPWHIYANPVGNPDLERAATSISVRSEGKLLKTEAAYPKGAIEQDKAVGAYRIYDKVTVIDVAFVGGVPDGPLEVSVKVQACLSGEGGRCLLQTTLKTTAK